jgi:hypothetical protein
MQFISKLQNFDYPMIPDFNESWFQASGGIRSLHTYTTGSVAPWEGHANTVGLRNFVENFP